MKAERFDNYAYYKKIIEVEGTHGSSLALSLRVRTRLLDIQCSPHEGDTKEYHDTVMFAADTVCDNSTTNPDNNRSSDHEDR